MDRRAAQTEDTRRRLIDAAVALHAERGLVGTRPSDVAASADVTLTTYYKHFPDRGSLVMACTVRAGDLQPPPKPALVAAETDPAKRVALAVRLLFDYYELREPWIFAGRTEERYVPEVGPVMARLRDLRNGFVAAAVPPRMNADRRAIAQTLMDFWSWRTLRRDAGLDQPHAIRSVADAIVSLGGPRRRR